MHNLLRFNKKSVTNSHMPKINNNIILKINRRVKKSKMGLHIEGKRYIDDRCSTPLGLITVVRKHFIAL